MLTRKIFLDKIKRLDAAFRNGNPTSEETIKLYWEKLKERNDGEFSSMVEFIIDNDHYFPSIARFNERSYSENQYREF